MNARATAILAVLAAVVLTPAVGRTRDFSKTLNAGIGKATRADFLMVWGAPAQNFSVDGDEFWTYGVRQRDAMVDMAGVFGSAAAEF